MIAQMWAWVRKGASAFFSSRVEDSSRLRIAGFAALLVSAASLYWVGGEFRFAAAGALLGAAGHLFSYRMRYRPSKLRPVLISVAVITLSVLMRNQMLETFNGNWMHVGHYLILVNGLSSFDMRTRGGLYTGLILSGTVLFFASQQAFNYSFGIFIMAFIVVMLGFLVVSFLEDGMRSSTVRWAPNRPITSIYWTTVACALFVVAGLTFWLIPRGDNSLIGPPQLAVLPYSPNNIEFDPELLEMELSESDLPIGGEEAAPESEQGPFPSVENGMGGPGAAEAGLDGDEGGPGAGRSQLGDGRESPINPDQSSPVFTPDNVEGIADSVTRGSQTRSGGRQGSETGRGNAATETAIRGNRDLDPDDEIVFHVRTHVASYWRGLALEEFNGASWLADSQAETLIKSDNYENFWYSRETPRRREEFQYPQTFYLKESEGLPIFTGYQPLRVRASDTVGGDATVTGDSSYRVISALPEHTPEELRLDLSRGSTHGLTRLPAGSERVIDLAERITQGATSDFEKLERTVSYLATTTEFDPTFAGALESSASLEEFLFEGRPGSVLDYATATVMLARASGLPSRLALGYLPGTRDPLTGTYRVRQSDAHAWAEVSFLEAGWVPFDSAPRTPVFLKAQPASGVERLFQSNLGENVYGNLKEGPQRAFNTLMDGLSAPAFLVVGPAIIVIALVIRLLQSNSRRTKDSRTSIFLAYNHLTGRGRRELRKFYLDAERMLARAAGAKRATWQTAGQYHTWAAGTNHELAGHLAWFKQALWQANYRSEELPAGMVAEARTRLGRLKTALRHAPRVRGATNSHARTHGDMAKQSLIGGDR